MLHANGSAPMVIETVDVREECRDCCAIGARLGVRVRVKVAPGQLASYPQGVEFDLGFVDASKG